MFDSRSTILKASEIDIRYAKGRSQWGRLFLPPGHGLENGRVWPLLVAIHGGIWSAENSLDHLFPLCRTLAARGIAVWCPEFRRVGEPGGGWPGTFDDIAAAINTAIGISSKYRLSTERRTILGHSAGGHLCLWAASRHALKEGNPHRIPAPLFKTAVALAPATDLSKAHALNILTTRRMIEGLLGGTPSTVPARYRDCSPALTLPHKIREYVVHGMQDELVPIEWSRAYVASARNLGDSATLVAVDGSDHFDVIAPEGFAWGKVMETVLSALGP